MEGCILCHNEVKAYESTEELFCETCDKTYSGVTLDCIVEIFEVLGEDFDYCDLIKSIGKKQFHKTHGDNTVYLEHRPNIYEDVLNVEHDSAIVIQTPHHMGVYFFAIKYKDNGFDIVGWF